jgi:hypothetical protein
MSHCVSICLNNSPIPSISLNSDSKNLVGGPKGRREFNASIIIGIRAE